MPHRPFAPAAPSPTSPRAPATIVVAALLAGCVDATSPVPARSPDATPRPATIESAPLRAKNRIVFVRDGDIYIMNANGSGTQRLTTTGANNFSPALSPDGSHVAFVRANGASDIYVMNVDGTGVVPLTQNAGDNQDPAWSPDGARIAFASNRGQSSSSEFDVYVMNADGTAPEPLTSSPGWDLGPAWAPDGSRIAFWSTRDTGTPDIYVMAATGGTASRLTTSPYWDYHPTWSPDGRRIAYVCDTKFSDTPFQSSYEICTMNADGSGGTTLTRSYTSFDYQPSWSPDGKRIAFASNRDGDFEIFSITADGHGLSQLTRNSADDQEPNWR